MNFVFTICPNTDSIFRGKHVYLMRTDLFCYFRCCTVVRPIVVKKINKLCTFCTNFTLIISVNNDKNNDDATDGDYQMDENPGSVEEISKEIENNENENNDEADSAKVSLYYFNRIFP